MSTERRYTDELPVTKQKQPARYPVVHVYLRQPIVEVQLTTERTKEDAGREA